MDINTNLIEFRIPKANKVRFYFYNMRNRLLGNVSKIDQLQIACYCEPPMYFLLHGVTIPHAYGITLSVDEIGADCLIGQNVTIGTDKAYVPIGKVLRDEDWRMEIFGEIGKTIENAIRKLESYEDICGMNHTTTTLKSRLVAAKELI